jgi:hypothetical protein
MAAWNAGVAEPFASDRDFSVSVGASADALLAMVVAVALTLLLGRYAAVAFVVPVVFLIRAGLAGRVSASRSRAAFDNNDAWKAAERDAVAKSFGRALVRRRFG